MSRESDQHVGLVERAVATVKAEYHALYSLVILADLPSFGRDRPPYIGGFIPDVFAIDAPETVRVIAEAKTPNDLETPRSHRQICAFMRHLSSFPHASLLLFVPWLYTARANTLLSAWGKDVGCTKLTVRVIGG
jgi:hypothetical protein